MFEKKLIKRVKKIFNINKIYILKNLLVFKSKNNSVGFIFTYNNKFVLNIKENIIPQNLNIKNVNEEFKFILIEFENKNTIILKKDYLDIIKIHQNIVSYLKDITLTKFEKILIIKYNRNNYILINLIYKENYLKEINVNEKNINEKIINYKDYYSYLILKTNLDYIVIFNKNSFMKLKIENKGNIQFPKINDFGNILYINLTNKNYYFLDKLTLQIINLKFNKDENIIIKIIDFKSYLIFYFEKNLCILFDKNNFNSVKIKTFNELDIIYISQLYNLNNIIVVKLNSLKCLIYNKYNLKEIFYMVNNEFFIKEVLEYNYYYGIYMSNNKWILVNKLTNKIDFNQNVCIKTIVKFDTSLLIYLFNNNILLVDDKLLKNILPEEKKILEIKFFLNILVIYFNDNTLELFEKNNISKINIILNDNFINSVHSLNNYLLICLENKKNILINKVSWEQNYIKELQNLENYNIIINIFDNYICIKFLNKTILLDNNFSHIKIDSFELGKDIIIYLKNYNDLFLIFLKNLNYIVFNKNNKNYTIFQSSDTNYIDNIKIYKNLLVLDFKFKSFIYDKNFLKKINLINNDVLKIKNLFEFENYWGIYFMNKIYILIDTLTFKQIYIPELEDDYNFIYQINIKNNILIIKLSNNKVLIYNKITNNKLNLGNSLIYIKNYINWNKYFAVCLSNYKYEIYDKKTMELIDYNIGQIYNIKIKNEYVILIGNLTKVYKNNHKLMKFKKFNVEDLFSYGNISLIYYKKDKFYFSFKRNWNIELF